MARNEYVEGQAPPDLVLSLLSSAEALNRAEQAYNRARRIRVQTIRLAYDSGMSFSSIGKVLGISVERVRQLWQGGQEITDVPRA